MQLTTSVRRPPAEGDAAVRAGVRVGGQRGAGAGAVAARVARARVARAALDVRRRRHLAMAQRERVALHRRAARRGPLLALRTLFAVILI